MSTDALRDVVARLNTAAGALAVIGAAIDAQLTATPLDPRLEPHANAVLEALAVKRAFDDAPPEPTPAPTCSIAEVNGIEIFTRKNDDGREADRRLDTMQGATVRGMVATLHADLTQRGGVMIQTMTRGNESSAATGYLLVAFELSQRWWQVGFTTGMGHRVRTRRVAAGALASVADAIADAQKMFGLAADARVISCYEAGREGFWLHRYLTGRGATNYVVDSASIEVDRRARRTKTDAVDLRGLLALLARYVVGDRRGWRVVRVPSVADEDARQLHRTWETLQEDRTRVINRLKAVLATQGVRLAITPDFLEHVAATRVWDGSEIPPGARARLAHHWAQLQGIEKQLVAVKAARARLRIDPATATGRAVQALQGVRAIGAGGAWVLATEIFGWREIRNGRQLGALVGLAPALYQSGATQRDRGITRAGNAHVRRMMVQLAWGWLRWQSDSALAQWYQRRFATGGSRQRRIGIVALARKLLIALWRYVDQAIVPEGARLKVTVA